MTEPGNGTRPRRGMYRLIRQLEYRHHRAFAGVCLAGGGFSLGIGAVLLSLGRQADTDDDRRKCFKLAAWFLVSGALQLSAACWT